MLTLLIKQRDLLLQIIENLKIILGSQGQIGTDPDAIRQCRLAYDRMTNRIKLLSWDDYQVKDFNRDIPWDGLVSLNILINAKDADVEQTLKIFQSLDFTELFERLTAICNKQEKIIRLVEVLQREPQNVTEQILKNLYSDSDLRFDSTAKALYGLPFLNSIIAYHQDLENVRILLEGIKILETVDPSTERGRCQLMAVVITMGEASKLLSKFSEKHLDAETLDSIATLRDKFRHAADYSETQRTLKSFIKLTTVNTLLLLDARQTILKTKSALAKYKKFLEIGSSQNLKLFELSPAPTLSQAPTRGQLRILHDLYSSFSEVENLRNPVLTPILLRDIESRDLLVPFQIDKRKAFAVDLIQSYLPFKKAASKKIGEMTKGLPRKEREAIGQKMLVNPQNSERIIYSLLMDQPKFTEKRDERIVHTVETSIDHLAQLLTFEKAPSTSSAGPRRSYEIIQLDYILWILDQLDELAEDAKILRDVISSSLSPSRETLETPRNSKFYYTGLFYLVQLSQAVRNLRNGERFALLPQNLISDIELLRHVGNAYAHLQESHLEVLPLAAGFFAIDFLKGPMSILIEEQDNPQITLNKLTDFFHPRNKKAQYTIEEKKEKEKDEENLDMRSPSKKT